MSFRPVVEKFDKALMLHIQALWHQSFAIDAAMIVIGKWTPIVMLLLIFLASVGVGMSDLSFVFLIGHALAAIVAAVLGRLCNQPISNLMNRRRPFEIYGFVPLLGHERGHSFPSNHATGALALAATMWPVTGYGPVLLALAVLLCISRVYTGLHHLTDVLAGALNGTFWAIVCLFLLASVYPS